MTEEEKVLLLDEMRHMSFAELIDWMMVTCELIGHHWHKNDQLAKKLEEQSKIMRDELIKRFNQKA